MRILVIDDENGDRLLLQTMLCDAGFLVDVATDGGMGLSLVKKNRYDLVITDIFMPDVEGFDVIVALKQDFPDTKIIAISAGGLVGDSTVLDMAESLGADDVMAKPIDGDWLVKRITALCCARQLPSYAR